MSAFEEVDSEYAASISGSSTLRNTKLFADEDSPPQDENGRSSVNTELLNGNGDMSSSSGFVKAQQLFGDASPAQHPHQQQVVLMSKNTSSHDLISPVQLSSASKSEYAAASQSESSHSDSPEASLSRADEESSASEHEQQPQQPAAQDEGLEETAAQRAAREERESELLAWQLMQEENRQMYALQQQFMRENSDGMTEEDLQAIQAAIDESGRVDLVATDAADAGNNNSHRRARRRNNDEDISGDEQEDGDEAEYEEEEEEEDDTENWDYERLLELGYALGDVKTERWRLRAKSVIDSLPLISFAECKARHGSTGSSDDSTNSYSSTCVECAVHSTSSASASASTTVTAAAQASPESSSSSSGGNRELTHKKSSGENNLQQYQVQYSTAEKTVLTAAETNDSNKKMRLREIDVRCAVCMEDFSDEEQLLLLPCKHYFHTACIAQWMGDHNTCPTCKCKISATPEKK